MVRSLAVYRLMVADKGFNQKGYYCHVDLLSLWRVGKLESSDEDAVRPFPDKAFCRALGFIHRRGRLC